MFHGSLDNPKSYGTNTLIKEFAELVISPKDIINKYSFLQKIDLPKKKNIGNNKINVGEQYLEIYKIIGEKPIGIDEIIKKYDKNLNEVMSELTMLELERYIKKLPGNRYVKGEEIENN